MPRLLLALGLLWLVGCAGQEARPIFRPEVAPITSGTAAPDELAAHALLEEEAWAEASRAFEDLSTFEAAPDRRAEFLFLAGESALADDDAARAYDLYTKLLRRYPNTPRHSLVVERLFEIGRRFAEARAERPTWLLGIEMTDRPFGIQVLEEFHRARERHALADDALYLIGEAHLAEAEPELAVGSWQKIVDEYPKSEWADPAEYRIGLAFIGMSSGPEYDKAPLLTGLSRLRSYVKRHPTGNHVDEATAEIARVEEGLARHLLDVARFYLRWDRRYATLLYCDAIQRDYPRTEAAKEAKRLADSLPKTSPPAAPDVPDEALDAKPTEPPPPPPDPLTPPRD